MATPDVAQRQLTRRTCFVVVVVDVETNNAEAVAAVLDAPR